jgi:hypothetical protein
VVSVCKDFLPKICMHFSSITCMLHAPPISFSFIWSPYQYFANSTNYEAYCNAAVPGSCTLPALWPVTHCRHHTYPKIYFGEGRIVTKANLFPTDFIFITDKAEPWRFAVRICISYSVRMEPILGARIDPCTREAQKQRKITISCHLNIETRNIIQFLMMEYYT